MRSIVLFFVFVMLLIVSGCAARQVKAPSFAPVATEKTSFPFVAADAPAAPAAMPLAAANAGESDVSAAPAVPEPIMAEPSAPKTARKKVWPRAAEKEVRQIPAPPESPNRAEPTDISDDIRFIVIDDEDEGAAVIGLATPADGPPGILAPPAASGLDASVASRLRDIHMAAAVISIVLGTLGGILLSRRRPRWPALESGDRAAGLLVTETVSGKPVRTFTVHPSPPFEPPTPVPAKARPAFDGRTPAIVSGETIMTTRSPPGESDGEETYPKVIYDATA